MRHPERPPPPRASADRAWWLSLALLVGATLPYLPTLGYGFLAYDDPFFITREPFWQRPSLTAAVDVLRRPVWGSYHPLHQLSYLVDRAVWGPTPLGVRVTQVALYGLCCWLVLLVARRLRLAPVACVAAALLFAWHPAHVENVAWASQRKDLLSAAFTLAAIAAYLGPAGAGPDRGRRWVLVCAWVVLGLLSKSVTVVALPILCALALALGRARRDVGWIAALGALGAVVVRVHYLAQLSVGATSPPPASRLEHARVVTRALAGYALDMALPLAPSPLSPPVPPPDGWDVVAAAALLSAVALAALAWRRGARRPAVFVAWFFVALLPTSGVVPVPTFTQDRYLLLPSAGAALLAGELLASLGRRSRRARRALVALASTGLVLLASTTTGYVHAWRDDIALWTWAAKKRPDQPAALAAVAGALADAGHWDEAERWTSRALALAPTLSQANFVQGKLLMWRGDRAGARERFALMLKHAVGHMRHTAGMYLVALALDEGDLDAAERELERAALLAPRWAPEVLASRAQLRLLGGDPTAAAALLEEALRLTPGWQEAWARLSIARRLAGATAEARAAAANEPDVDRRTLEAHLALDAGDVTRAEALVASLGDEPRHGLEEELVLARLDVRRGEVERAAARLSRLATTIGRGALPRAALEPELRGLARGP